MKLHYLTTVADRRGETSLRVKVVLEQDAAGEPVYVRQVFDAIGLVGREEDETEESYDVRACLAACAPEELKRIYNTAAEKWAEVYEQEQTCARGIEADVLREAHAAAEMAFTPWKVGVGHGK